MTECSLLNSSIYGLSSLFTANFSTKLYVPLPTLPLWKDHDCGRWADGLLLTWRTARVVRTGHCLEQFRLSRIHDHYLLLITVSTGAHPCLQPGVQCWSTRWHDETLQNLMIANATVVTCLAYLVTVGAALGVWSRYSESQDWLTWTYVYEIADILPFCFQEVTLTCLWIQSTDL